MFNLREFQSRYGLSNRQMAGICACSVPTIQKWRSGEVRVSGSAQQLCKYLDASAQGDAHKLWEILKRMENADHLWQGKREEDLDQLESSMTEMMDRLELLLQNRRQEKQLKESEARYRSMVDVQEDPVCRWKPDTTLTYVNEAYARMFSEYGSDLVGRQWLDFVPGERHGAVRAVVSDIVRRGEVDSYEHEVVDGNGEVRHILWTDMPIKDELGNVVELHSLGRDQTERVRMKGEVKELRRVLEASFGLAGRALCWFDQNGTLQGTNSRFEHEIARGKNLRCLQELGGKFPDRKFHQLLSKLPLEEEVFYHVKVGDRVLAWRVRLVRSARYRREYLASVEDESKLLREQPTLHVRFSNEAVVAGKTDTPCLSPERREKLEGLLAQLGVQVMAGRVFVFVYDASGQMADNLLEWCTSEVCCEQPNLQRLDMSHYAWWQDRITRGRWIKVPDVAAMPARAKQEKALLEAQGVKAVLAAPLGPTGNAMGFVGFDETSAARMWHKQEVQALESLRGELADALAGALGSGKG